MWTVITIAAVGAFLSVGWWQYRRLSRPFIDYTQSVSQLADRLSQDDMAADWLGDLAGTDVGTAAAAVVANGDARTFSARELIGEASIAIDVPELRWFETIPGQFIGAGLAVTFLLLAIAVGQAAGALTEPSQSLELPMQNLLRTAGLKFTVSIAAILVSLVLVHRRTQLLVAAERALAALAVALDRRFPPGPAVNEALELTRQQAATLARLEDKLAVLHDPQAALAAALGEAMLPVAASINTMGDRVAATNTESLERMVAAFTRELGGATLRYNQQLAETLRETSAALHDAPDRIGRAAKATEELLDAAADRTGAALATAGEVFTAAAVRLQAIADQAQRAEQRLDGALDTATSNADGTADRLAELTARLETAGVAVAAACVGAEQASAALADATESGNVMRAAMTADTSAWTSGMQQVDASVATIVGRLRSLLPEAGPVDRDSFPIDHDTPVDASQADGSQPQDPAEMPDSAGR